MRGWRLAPILLAGIVLVGCGEFRPVGPEYHYLRHRVQRGETLYSIAFRFGYDYREVAAWNGIPPPYTIYTGEELLVLSPERPVSGAEEAPPRQAEAAVPAGKPDVKASAPDLTKPVTSPGSRQPEVPAPAPRVASGITWSWPTQGKVLGRFSAGAGRKGVDMGGRLGQPVKAAADGYVVYSGNGLLGYGNLVIIKHDDTFLSAYGHNRRLLVKEGHRVKAGQVIGEMGQHPKTGSILHFEIRRNGKPVDPLLYLPNQTS